MGFGAVDDEVLIDVSVDVGLVDVDLWLLGAELDESG